MIFTASFGVLLSAILVTGIRLPSYVPRCSRNDPLISQCLVRTAINLKPYLRSGIPEMGLPPLRYVVFPTLKVKHSLGDTEFNAIQSNLTLQDMDQFELSNVEFYPEEITLRGELIYDLLPFSLYFSTKGKLIGLPFNGDRFFRGYWQGFNGKFMVKGQLFKTGNVEYCRVYETKFDLRIQKLYGDLHGQKTAEFGLDSQTVSNNPESVAAAMQPVFGKAFELMLNNYVTELCEKVPYERLFPSSLIQ